RRRDSLHRRVRRLQAVRWVSDADNRCRALGPSQRAVRLLSRAHNVVRHGLSRLVGGPFSRLRACVGGLDRRPRTRWPEGLERTGLGKEYPIAATIGGDRCRGSKTTTLV